jgi:uncharacterized membrane protein
MNKIFNPARFGKLFVKHTTEHYKGYLMALAVLIGVLELGGSFLVYMIDAPLDHSTQSALFLIILLIAGTIYTSTIFADLGEKNKSIAFLTLPATHFEKYLVAWLYSFLAFLVIYAISFYLVALFLLNIRHVPGQAGGVINLWQKQYIQMGLVYAFLHAIAFWGAICFNKLHFIKTAFVFFIFLGLLILFNKIVLTAMIDRNVDAAPPFGSLRFQDGGRQVDITLPDVRDNPTLTFLVLGLTLVIWIAAYYRLKEKQV